jgi:hypothetical protein
MDSHSPACFTTTVEATERSTSCFVVFPHASLPRPRSIFMPTSDRGVEETSATLWKKKKAIKRGVSGGTRRVWMRGVTILKVSGTTWSNCKDFCLTYVWVMGMSTIRDGQSGYNQFVTERLCNLSATGQPLIDASYLDYLAGGAVSSNNVDVDYGTPRRRQRTMCFDQAGSRLEHRDASWERSDNGAGE